VVERTGRLDKAPVIENQKSNMEKKGMTRRGEPSIRKNRFSLGTCSRGGGGGNQWAEKTGPLPGKGSWEVDTSISAVGGQANGGGEPN